MRKKLYEKLVLKKEFFNKVLWEKDIEYLLWYYDNELKSDYIYWCYWNFEMPIYIEWGDLLLEWYLIREYQEENTRPGCPFEEDECPQNLPSYKYKFILTEDIEDKNYLKRVEYIHYEMPNKKWDKIELWCEINNTINSLWYLTSPLENLDYTSVYEIDRLILDKMKNSSEEKPIEIYWTYGMNFWPNTTSTKGSICWWEFKYIEVLE